MILLVSCSNARVCFIWPISYFWLSSRMQRMSLKVKLQTIARTLSRLILSSLLLMPALALAFTPFVIRDIQVQGLQRLDPGAVFGYLPVGVGDEFTEDHASET